MSDCWDPVDQAAWEAWVRESWLPTNAAGLPRPPVDEAREESETSKEESWKESKIPFRQAWI